MTCPCEGCKELRRQKLERRRAKAELRARAAQAAEELDKHARRVGLHVIERCREHLDDTWTSQDGRTQPLQAMAMAHLLYAAAKMDREGRAGPYKKLASEILRRLAKAHYPQSFHAPNAEGNYRHLPPPGYMRGAEL